MPNPSRATLAGDLGEFTEAFESHWHRGIEIAEFLPAETAANFAEIAGELIRLDMEYRWRSGEQATVENYLHLFGSEPPNANELNELAFEEYRLRDQFDQSVAPEVFQRRLGVDITSWPRWTDNKCAAGPGSTDRPDRDRDDLPQVGETLLGYDLVGLLGQGTFGRVYLARQIDLANRFVAVKLTEACGKEPEILARLQHTNIVPIYSLQRAAGLQCLCMPFLGVVTLRDLLERSNAHQTEAGYGQQIISTVAQHKVDTVLASTKPTDQQLEIEAVLSATEQSKLSVIVGKNWEETVLWMMSRVADGLAFAHAKGVIHGDLKPGNVLISDDGQPIILDFHLAHTDMELDDPEFVGGTLPYMSAEQLNSLAEGHPIDTSCDLFSFGTILYEALTGQLPYPLRGSDPDAIKQMVADRTHPPANARHINPRLSIDIASIVERCLLPDAARRYESAAQIREDIERHLENLPLKHAPNRSLVERVRKWTHRHPRLSSLAMILVCVALVALAAIAFISGRLARAARIEAIQDSQQFVADLYHEIMPLTAPQMNMTHVMHQQERVQEVLRKRQYLRPHQLPKAFKFEEDQSFWYGQFWAARGLIAVAMIQTDANRQKSMFRKAIENLDAARLLIGGPLPSPLLRLQADLHRRIGEFERANELARQANESGDERPSLVTELISAAELRLAGDEEAALRKLSQLAVQNPHDYRIWLMKGQAHLHLREIDKAIVCYDMCVGQDPSATWGYFYRGYAYLEKGDFASAKLDFDRCIELDSTDSTNFLNRAIAFRGLNQMGAAIADLSRAIELDCPQTRAYYLRYQAYQSLNEITLAKADLDEFLALEPSDEKSWVTRGIAHLRADDPKSALSDFEHALTINPTSGDAWQNIASVQAENLGNATAAVDALNKLLELNPRNDLARVTRGVMYGRLRDRAAAHADGEFVLRGSANSDIIYRAAGIFALTADESNSDGSRAIDLLRKAAAYDPQLVVSRLGNDPDLESLREQKAFQELVTILRDLVR